jgi:hypothetical protein
MKTFRCGLRGTLFFLMCAVFFGVGARLRGQTSGPGLIPVVTIQATQPIASGPGHPGVFTVFRQGNTNETLNVYYDIGGSASNGVDYAEITQWVTIPAGVFSNTILITPPASLPSGGAAKTVVLQLAPSPLLNPVNFAIGVPSNAVVYITGPATNLPPNVGIISPTNGSIFYTPTNILLAAKASDPDGSIVNVEFFAGTNDLGPGSPVVLDPPGINGVTGLVYIYNWLNPSANNYSLTAVATDNGGASTISAPVDISVLPGPSTNPSPAIRIVSPANNATFFAPVNIPLFAYVTYSTDSTVTSVQFFDGTNSLGFGQPVPTPVAANASGSVPPVYPTNFFSLVWSNAPVGSHILTAQATIAFINHPLVLITQSPPVDITVLAAPPPPTNRPPIVDIVATDPVAVEGANSWVWRGETNSPATWAAWPPAVCRFFTNCGPKTATFTISRCGETDDDLTVTYNIGGTASNGVDYVALPGFVTVPAGELSALITIVPIDDGPPDINKTVILALAASTNYVVGCPPRAAAVIIDPPGPCATASMLPDKCFRLTMPGPDGAWFGIECSTDLVHWTALCTNQVINGSIDFVDPNAPNCPDGYYRITPLTNAPGD